MVVAPSEQRELQNAESVGIIQGREPSPCSWTALGLHLDPASSCWVVSLRFRDLSQRQGATRIYYTEVPKILPSR